MAYTAFKHDPAETRKRAASIRKRFLARNPGKNPLAYGVEIMSEMLEEDPRRYLTYGPYWWALKDVLLRHGCAFGDTMDFEIAREYRGEDGPRTPPRQACQPLHQQTNCRSGQKARHSSPCA